MRSPSVCTAGLVRAASTTGSPITATTASYGDSFAGRATTAADEPVNLAAQVKSARSAFVSKCRNNVAWATFARAAMSPVLAAS